MVHPPRFMQFRVLLSCRGVLLPVGLPIVWRLAMLASARCGVRASGRSSCVADTGISARTNGTSFHKPVVEAEVLE